jgi:hypothetical protein
MHISPHAGLRKMSFEKFIIYLIYFTHTVRNMSF